ncbi:MAG: hypothetical protein HYX26_01365 [Acidobacteriales bacterium]|nr:hypothetical protein [Terriglobales bacterium]
MVLPAISRSTLRGRRVEARRAGMMAMAFRSLPQEQNLILSCGFRHGYTLVTEHVFTTNVKECGFSFMTNVKGCGFSFMTDVKACGFSFMTDLKGCGFSFMTNVKGCGFSFMTNVKGCGFSRTDKLRFFDYSERVLTREESAFSHLAATYYVLPPEKVLSRKRHRFPQAGLVFHIRATRAFLDLADQPT